MLCRKCGHGIVKPVDFIFVPTAKALRQRNDTISAEKKTLIQLLENPQGNKFEVITARNTNAINVGEKSDEFSWFPGFSWEILICPHCGFHLGWKFTPADLEEEGEFHFFGLILSHLIGSTYAGSLLMTPKTYQS